MEHTNKINQIQNSEEILLYLFTQRKIYSKGKKTSLFLLTINLIFYILGLIDSIQSNDYFRILYVVWSLVFVVIYIMESEKISIAATIQEVIDRKLYGFNINSPNIRMEQIHQIALDTRSKYKKEYEIQVSNNGEYGGVKDWYSDVSGIQKEKAILLCQIENCEWEIKLRERFQKFNFISFIFLIGIYVVIYRDYNIGTLIIKLYPILTIVADRLGYLYKNSKNISGNKNINNYLYQIYDNIDNYSKEEIIDRAKDIQSCIYESCIYDRRKNHAPIPDYFYNLHREKYQSFSNEFIMDLKNKLQN